MRIDQYLWCIRFYKTRSIATNAIKNNKVILNNKTVKPSKEVFPQDLLVIRKNQISYKIEVLDIPKSRVGAKIVDLYRKDRTEKEQFDTQKMQQIAQEYYRKKGEGRPTKKDRRDLDDYFFEDEDNDAKNTDK